MLADVCIFTFFTIFLMSEISRRNLEISENCPRKSTTMPSHFPSGVNRRRLDSGDCCVFLTGIFTNCSFLYLDVPGDRKNSFYFSDGSL